jgi:PhnB protein
MAMTTHASHQPTGYPTVSVYMMADGAQRVINFMTDVLGGETLMRLDRDNGTVLHAAVRIGDSVIMLSDGTAEAPAFPVWLHVYVRDVDETYQRALDYGAGSVQTPSEQGDGDRRGGIKDPAGNTWWIATHLGR